MKSLVQFINESKDDAIMQKTNLLTSIPYATKKTLEYMFYGMEDSGYDLNDDDIKDILSVISRCVSNNSTKVIASHLFKKMNNGGRHFLITMDEMDKYNDKKDILSDWLAPYYYGDSHEYIKLVERNGEFYAKGYVKPFPYKEMDLFVDPEREDYMPTKDDPFKFEATH